MSLSMHQLSVVVFTKALSNLAGVLEKAKAHALAHKIEEVVYTNARLSPDMFPLSRQVQIATDIARGAAAIFFALLFGAVAAWVGGRAGAVEPTVTPGQGSFRFG